MNARIELEGHDPSSSRTPSRASAAAGRRRRCSARWRDHGVVAVQPLQALTIKSIECETVIEPGRATAEIEATELDAETYCPGDTVRATVFVGLTRAAASGSACS